MAERAAQRRSRGRVASRKDLLEVLARVGRENSDATVLFHSTVATLLDLHPTDYKVLGILERKGPLSAGDIAGESGLAHASVTNLIDRLERKGFVRRRSDPHDGRRVLVEALADRVGDASAFFASTRRSVHAMWQRYSTPELAVIADFLSENARRLRAETAALTRAGPPVGKTAKASGVK